MSAAVIIPCYKEKLSPTELVSLEQCLKILHNYPIILAIPNDMNDISYRAVFEKNKVTFQSVSFDNLFFKNIESYNRLMLDLDFYEKFLTFDYILIYQLDAFVFKDELDFWCSKDYDYVGSPWVNYPKNHSNLKVFVTWYFYSKVFQTLSKFFKFSDKYLIVYGVRGSVGNGGFSLRKVNSFVKCLQEINENKLHSDYLKKFRYNEDAFWSLWAKKYYNLKIPIATEANFFALEYPTKKDIAKNIPFGCHAWDEDISLWNKIIDL